MPLYKEIVTKAIIGKGKKTFKDKYSITLEDNIDTVLGCWVINHTLSGKVNNGSVIINGSFDINIWYSYDNNSKTNVASKKIKYIEKVNVRLKESSALNESSEIILRSLKNPSCIDVNVNRKTINYEIEKELGIEIVGDTKVKIAIEKEEEEYDIIEDDVIKDDEIDLINENYIKDNKK